jgi:hypothetical protein
MKLSELLTNEAKAGKGMWVIKSKDGVEKRFKDDESPEAVVWKATIAKKPKAPKPKDWWEDDEPVNKPPLGHIWAKFQEAFGVAFPDGHPLDHMSRWCHDNNVTADDIDDAVREFGGAKDVNTYMADAWDDHARDANHDAMQGHHGENYDNAWFTQKNPHK